MSKTTQFLRILHQLSLAPNRCLPESRIKQLLDDPPRSTWHRLISELTQGSHDVPALLMATQAEAGEERQYCVNHRGWQAFLDAHAEGKFLLECYRQVGHLLDSEFAHMVFELPDLDRREVDSLSRKFIHLVKIKTLQTTQSRRWLDCIIEGLIKNQQLELTYEGGVRTVRPLTLCQHRDELYLMCYRMIEGGAWEKRTYKLNRISGIRLLERKFPYPPQSEWDPAQEYESASGLVLGPVKLVQLRVYGNTRRIMAEKDFFNAELIQRESESDTYQCSYTNHHEFLGQLFVYAQDIEILNDDSLREQFLEKAHSAILRNQRIKAQSA
jgi:predicted DNA-binding transcriptional regulator YafY